MNEQQLLRAAILDKVSEVMPLGIATEVVVRDNHDLPMGTVRVIVEQGQAGAEWKVGAPMSEFKAGDRVFHSEITKTGTVTRFAGGPDYEYIVRWDDDGREIGAWCRNLRLLPSSDNRTLVVDKPRATRQIETQEPSLRNYDKPSDRDAQRRAILLAEMSRPVKGER